MGKKHHRSRIITNSPLCISNTTISNQPKIFHSLVFVSCTNGQIVPFLTKPSLPRRQNGHQSVDPITLSKNPSIHGGYLTPSPDCAKKPADHPYENTRRVQSHCHGDNARFISIFSFVCSEKQNNKKILFVILS